MNPKLIATISIFLIVIIWGSASSVTKVAVEDIPPYLFAFLRNLVASICLVPFFLVRKKKGFKQPSIPPKSTLFWMALTGVALFYIFFNLGLFYTTASAGALIQGFIPVAIILLAILFLRETLKTKQTIGIILSIIGVVMIGFIGEMPQARNNLLGNVLIIFAVLSWGSYTIISKRMEKYDSVYLTSMTTWIGTALLLPAVAIEYYNDPVIPSISVNGWLAILYLGVFSSAICYVLYNRVMKTLSAVQVGNFMNLDPVFGAVIAVIFLKEEVTPWQIGGAALVLVGVVVTSRSK